MILGCTSRIDELDAKIFQVITELKLLPETLGMLIRLEALSSLLHGFPGFVDVNSVPLNIEDFSLWRWKFDIALDGFTDVSLSDSFLPTGGIIVSLLFGRWPTL